MSALLVYPAGSSPGDCQALPLNRSRRASSLVMPHSRRLTGRTRRWRSRRARRACARRRRAALLDLDRADGPLGFVVGEDVPVGAGGEAEDQVLEGAEPAGEAAGVFRGGGAPVEVGGQPGGGERPVAG